MMADQIKNTTQGVANSQAADTTAKGGDNTSENKFKLRKVDGKVVPVFAGNANYNAKPGNAGYSSVAAPKRLDVANLIDVQKYNEAKSVEGSKYTPYIPMSAAMPSAPAESVGEYDANLDTENAEYDDYFDGEEKKPYEDFPQQKIYDTFVRKYDHKDDAFENVENAEPTYYLVTYKIRENDGMFRDNVESDAEMVQLFGILTYADGTSEIYLLLDLPDYSLS